MKFTEYVSSQFGNPRSMIGKICCLLMNILNGPLYHNAVKHISLKPHDKILDIGFGNGYFIKQLSKNTMSKIYGIDISEDMLVTASRKNKKAIDAQRMTLAIGDCCHLQFKEETFGAVSSINTIYFWPDPLKGLKEIYRVLKDEGVFYNMVYSKAYLQKLPYTKTGFKFFEVKDYVRLGKQAGFAEVIVEEIEKEKSYCVQFIK